MPSLREEPYSLNPFIVSTPSVQPFFGDKTIMLFLSQVTWSFDKRLDCRLVRVLRITMVDCSCLINLILSIFLLGFLQSLLSIFFKILNDRLLFRCHLSNLVCETFKALVICPRSFEISRHNIALPLSFHFNFPPLLLP